MSNQVISEALGLCFATGTPVLLWGPPGAGKTSAVQSVVEEIRRQRGLTEDQFVFETIIASLHEPSDFSGLPVLSGDRVKFVPPEWAVRAAEAGQGLVFFDEISLAPNAIQAALLRVIHERVVGTLRLGPGVVFCAAANPPEMAAGGWELAAPLANRFVHLNWMPTAAEVTAGFVGGFPAPTLPILPSVLGNSPTVTGLVVGFINARPAAMLDVPRDPAAASRGFPTPRSWETVKRLLTAIEICGATDEARNELIIGTVGEGVAHEFITYLDNADLPDPEALLADPAGFQIPERGDQRYAILAALSAAYLSNPTEARWEAVWTILAVCAEGGIVDVAAPAAMALARNAPPGVRAHPAVKAFIPILQQAGLIDDLINRATL